MRMYRPHHSMRKAKDFVPILFLTVTWTNENVISGISKNTIVCRIYHWTGVTGIWVYVVIFKYKMKSTHHSLERNGISSGSDLTMNFYLKIGENVF